MSGEASRCFRCFGGTVTVHVGGRDRRAGAEQAALAAELWLLDAHRRLTRFDPGSELCRLNRDPRAKVPVGPLLLELAVAVRQAGLLSGGLVDATQLEQIEKAGYAESLDADRGGPGSAGVDHPVEWVPARPSLLQTWRAVSVDRDQGTVIRPPGVAIDSGGIAKGLLADLLGARLEDHQTYAIDCAGDIRIGGRSALPRVVLVEDPKGGPPIHELAVRAGGVATSGITRRAWRVDGRTAHHLLDPSTGKPAFTGVLQATALAPTAFLAEVHAKEALLAGSAHAAERLPYGGVVVHADGAVEIVSEPSCARL